MSRFFDVETEREFFAQNLKNSGLKKAFSVMWHNFRFKLGFAIGGFTEASNYKDGEEPDEL